MPNILIVDDEPIFRKGLRAMITARDASWTIVGDARDGYEALEMLESLRPDVLLTDIRMPRMDGLQLQTIARDKFPELRCVVISGYEDFIYLQQSMRSGARDYIMKPVEREELYSVLDRLLEELRQRQNLSRDAIDSPETIDAQSRAGSRLAARLAGGSVNQGDLDLLAKVGIRLNEPCFNVLTIKLDKESVDEQRYLCTDPHLFQLYIRQFVQEIIDLRMSGFSFVMSDTTVAALINMPDDVQSHWRLLETAESIRRQIRSLSNLSVTIGVGRTVRGFEAMPSSFRDADRALLYRLVVGGDKVLSYADLADDPLIRTDSKEWSWEPLQRAINEGLDDEAGKITTDMVDELCRLAQTPEYVHRHICKLLLHYHELSEDMGVTNSWLGSRDIRTLLSEICSINSSQELIEECRSLFSKLALIIARCQQAVEHDPITQALEYIGNNYQRPITLKDVADRVYLSPTYFSALFKQRIGRTFIEHVTGMRVEFARSRLATTNSTMLHIAEETGFTNIRHFNRVFKHETGFTPKEFRDAARKRLSK